MSYGRGINQNTNANTIADAEPRPGPPLTAEQRSMRGSAASHESWSRTVDRSARTAAARQAFMWDRFVRQVDPEGVLDPAERARRAESARKAWYAWATYRASRARSAAAAARRAAKREELAQATQPTGGAA